MKILSRIHWITDMEQWFVCVCVYLENETARKRKLTKIEIIVKTLYESPWMQQSFKLQKKRSSFFFICSWDFLPLSFSLFNGNCLYFDLKEKEERIQRSRSPALSHTCRFCCTLLGCGAVHWMAYWLMNGLYVFK